MRREAGVLRTAECSCGACVRQCQPPRHRGGLSGNVPPGTLWVKGQPSTAAQGNMAVCGTACHKYAAGTLWVKAAPRRGGVPQSVPFVKPELVLAFPNMSWMLH